MKFKKLDSGYLVRLEQDEEIIQTLTKFCQDQQINFGTISAIGAVKQTTIGWYELKAKNYHWQDFAGSLEICSLTGNIAVLNGQPFLHIHCIISNESLQSFGGHLKQARAGATLEVIITQLEGEVIRTMDDEVGLNLLDLNKSE